ncbi:MAG: DUF4358 domain-containing protein [Clostridia bacterium]|nr:DUF4358 domain-containing protein [Clostridia bacterium]
MKTIKVISIIVLATLMMLSAVSCGAEYKDDIKASALSEAALAKISVEGGYAVADADFMEFNFPDGAKYADDYAVAYAANTSANINEVGILHAKTAEDAKSLFEATKAYLADRKEAWMNAINYTPDEHPKMENAVCKQYGNYVVYTILTTADSGAVLEVIEGQLKK